MNNLKRIITALIGFPIVVCVLLFSNKYIIDVVFTVVGLIAMNEYLKCVGHKVKPIKWISYASVLLISLLHVIPQEVIGTYLPFMVPAILLILFTHVIATNMKTTLEDVAFTFLGICYIVGFIAFLPLLYGFEGKIQGIYLIGYVICATWGSDVFAYCVGRRIGKHKFTKVSPNKSIEGCVAGVIAAVALSLIFTFGINYFLNLGINYLVIAGFSFLFSIIGMIGDLAASVIKRYFDVKDYSGLFPGHGGMIDRIDSVMFVAPFAYLLLTMYF